MFMEDNEWMMKELERVYHKSQDFKQQALIRATQQIIREQDKRIWQMEGELDGTLWSPKKWNE
ncbi:MAG TPA: hypothetical protein VK091_06305 [Virgibacillus sp.]|nr:hypothetical protein [Virgibacillus sp.]